jgi:glucose/arabinose dehydrogenase/PKD repeat protein
MRRLLIAGAALLAFAPAAPAQTPPPSNQFQKVVIDATPGEPMDLAVLPDARVLHTERSGEVWLHSPATGLKTLAAKLDVYQHDEEGLQSIALDPNFASNRWVYLYYSPPLNTPVDDPATPTVNEGDAPFFGEDADFEPFKGHIQLSRFKWAGSTIDLASEQKILQVPVDRGICCHVGGDIVFDAAGNLILATGDDTNPFESDGYSPIDEREGRNPAFDAQRSSANTNDLRGKILRITVGASGGYTIPAGNLFVDQNELTRPEIYLMGLRNPFRIEFNQRTGELYVADYSPDASNPDPLRGPAGHGKWMAVTKPGNFGWPYCATAELPYIDYDFATGESGEAFDCGALVNESPHNTGATQLPPVTQPQVWYSYGPSAEFPALGTGGIGPMAGPAYRYDAKVASKKGSTAWPAYYDNVPLFYEWTRDYIKAFFGNGARIEDVTPTLDYDNPIDLEFGPDGSLYVLEYGDGFFGKNLPGAELARVDFVGAGGNRSPSVTAVADTTEGPSPLTVHFSAVASDPEGTRLRYAWDFDADGKIDSRQANPAHTYATDGVYRATVTVTDQSGRSSSDYVEVTVGNRPVVRFITPTSDQPFAFGDTVNFQVEVTDDQPIDCSRVRVTYILGHDEHGHPQTTASGCSGSITTTVPTGHDPANDDLHAVFVAEYTDAGSGTLPPLTGSDEVVLEPAG